MFDVEVITSLKPTDCGATCLQMLLKYYGIESDLDTLIEETKTGIIGCTMADLGKVGRKYGLDTKYYQTDAEDVATFDRPSIIWWKYNHYCICCGLDEDGKVVIINPDCGMYRMSMGTFASFFTDYVMTNGEPASEPSEKPSND